MKTLKFMLAAATAIGLASVTQADEYNTTGFEKLTVGTSVTTGVQDNRDGYSYFYYAGENPDDNESVITNGTPNIARPRGASAVDSAREKILQVSTGPEPLLRTYQGFTGQSPVAATDLTADTYVDTLVQFTVTPYTDTVTNTAADKLMIYLKESVTTNDLGVITDWDTNLVVIGGCVVGAEDTLAVAQEYVVKGVHVEGQHQDLKVEPHKWYRLTVKAIVNAGGRSGTYPGFCVYVDGKLCYFDVAAWNEDNRNFSRSAYESANTSKELVLSLLANGSNPASLQGVGFAGEGKVDDIVFSELDPFATVYDFTFAFDPQKVSAVTYTVGGATYDQAITTPIEVEENATVQITSLTWADALMDETVSVTGLAELGNMTYTVTNDASIVLSATEAYAQIGDTKYDSFASAFTAVANASGTVKVLRDLSDDSAPASLTTVAAGQSVVLDLNGKTISPVQSSYWATIAGTLVVTDSTANALGKIVSSPTKMTLFKVDGTFTLAAGTLDMTTTNPDNTASGFNVKAGGTAYMNGGTVLGRISSGVTNATLYVNGGTVGIVQSKNRGDVTINGGKVTTIEKTGTSENANIVIPGASVAQFGSDYSVYCASGYEMTLDNGWYVVTAVQPSDSWNTPSDDASVADSLEDDGFPASATNLVTSVSEFNAFVQYITNKVSGAAAPADLTEYEKANAALCYALNATAIPDAELTDADVTIDSIEKNADGSVALTVAIKGVTVGETVAPALLAKVVTAKGGTELGSLSSANVTVNGYGAEDGKVVITVEPAQALGTPTSFFMQTVINK